MNATGDERSHYYVHSTGGEMPMVETWSTDPFSYMPVNWRASWRKDLGAAVAGLMAPPGQLLHAVYGSPDRSPRDVENVLFYNVDTGRFVNAAHFGIRFERIYGLPAKCPRLLTGPPLHYHHYFFSEGAAGFRYWSAGRVLARWRTVGGRSTMLARCSSVWYAVKTGRLEAPAPPSKPPVRFGLRVTIHAPLGASIRLAAKLKTVFDGVISAFHQHDGTDELEVSNRIAAELDITHEVITKLLRSARGAVLGVRRVVHRHGVGVQWNPQDDACVAGELQVECTESSGQWALSGELFEVAEKSWA